MHNCAPSSSCWRSESSRRLNYLKCMQNLITRLPRVISQVSTGRVMFRKVLSRARSIWNNLRRRNANNNNKWSAKIPWIRTAITRTPRPTKIWRWTTSINSAIHSAVTLTIVIRRLWWTNMVDTWWAARKMRRPPWTSRLTAIITRHSMPYLYRPGLAAV